MDTYILYRWNVIIQMKFVQFIDEKEILRQDSFSRVIIRFCFNHLHN